MASTLVAVRRETKGKNEAVRTRQAGKIPAVLYGGASKTGESVSVDPKELSRIQGKKHQLVDVDDGVVRTVLNGPVKPFQKFDEKKEKPPVATTPLTVSLDPVEPAALIETGDPESPTDAITLREGEWSDWCHVTFDLGFFQSVTGICQFYLQSVRPEFKLYASPVNIDPEAAAQAYRRVRG